MSENFDKIKDILASPGLSISEDTEYPEIKEEAKQSYLKLIDKIKKNNIQENFEVSSSGLGGIALDWCYNDPRIILCILTNGNFIIGTKSVNLPIEKDNINEIIEFVLKNI